MTMVQPDLGSNSLVLPDILPKEMISITDELGRLRVKINSSSVSIIQECQRKALYTLKEGWRAETESPATLFGRSVHKALEVYYSGNPAERKLPSFGELEIIGYGHKPKTDGLIQRAVSAFVEMARPLSSLPETDKRSIQNGVWILHEYFKTYIDDPYVAYIDDRGPFIERSFTYRFHEDEDKVIDIFGTVDFAFRNTRTGEIVLGDHKTASFLSFQDSSYFDRDKPNHQYTMYALGANRVFGLKTENFMVNVVEVKAKPKTKTARGVSFPRQITKRTEEDFEELREVIEYTAETYINALRSRKWPMGGVDACNKYGGCQFKQVCAAPKSLRETLLKNKFKKGI